MTDISWHDIHHTLPKDGEIVLLSGKTGYSNVPLFICFGFKDENYRPNHGGPVRWLDEANDALTDRGWTVTHWALSSSVNLP